MNASGLLKCFGLALGENKFEDFNQGGLWAVFPPEIKQLSVKVMPKVAVMIYLYLKCVLIFLVPFSVLVGLKTGEYLDEVWETFITKDASIWYASIKFIISWWKSSLPSICTLSGIFTSRVVKVCFMKPIPWKRLHLELSE